MTSVLDRRISAAKREAEVARSQVLSTIAELRHRTDPHTIIAEAKDSARVYASELASDLTDKVRARPWLVAAAASALGLVIAGRAKYGADEDATPEDEQATNIAAMS